MTKNKYDISVIVTAHREGRLAHHTLKSIFRAVDYAKKVNVKTEIVAILDMPDKNTMEYFARHENILAHTEHTNFGDPGLARNHGVLLSSGKYIAFLDADDLFGQTWLKAAFDEAERMNRYSVLHPELVVCFGSMNLIAHPKSVYDDDFNPKNLIQYNYWNSVHFLAPRELLVENPFIETPVDSGFGYEDWHWHCEIIAKDIPIITVPNTVVFYRKKHQGSRLMMHDNQNVLIRPTKLFEPEIFSAVIAKYKSKQSKHGIKE